MAQDLCTYSEESVRELYASYATTLRRLIDKRSKTTKHDPITYTLVRGIQVDILQATIVDFYTAPPPVKIGVSTPHS